MAHPRTNLKGLRHFIILCLLAAGVSQIHGQPADKSGVTFRTLAVGKTLSGVFYEHRGEAIKITAGSSGFSAPYSAEANSSVEIYRELPPEKEGDAPKRLTLSQFELGETGPYLVLIKVNPDNVNEVRVKVVDASWEIHPPESMRVFNYSRRKALVKVGEAITELNPTDSHQFKYSEEFQVWLQAAVMENEEWTLRASSPQVLVPNTRSTIILIDQEPSVDRPVTHELLVRNFIERAPQVEK